MSVESGPHRPRLEPSSYVTTGGMGSGLLSNFSCCLPAPLSCRPLCLPDLGRWASPGHIGLLLHRPMATLVPSVPSPGCLAALPVPSFLMWQSQGLEGIRLHGVHCLP